MYKEHLEFQESPHIASPEHYPHLYHFSKNFNAMLGVESQKRKLRQFHFANSRQGQLSHLAHVAVKLAKRKLENIADPNVEANTILSTNAKVESGDVVTNDDTATVVNSESPSIINP